MRYLQLIAVCLVLGLGATGARAQAFVFYAYDEDNSQSLDEIEFPQWANMARCLCDEYAETQDASTATLNIRIIDNGPYTNEEVYIYLGDDCDSESTAISDVCRELAVINHSDFEDEQTIEVPVHRVVDPMGGQCTEINGGTTTLYVIMNDPNAAPAATLTISYDTAPPGVPSSVNAQGGEGAVSVSWDPPTTDDENIEFYDVLCAEASGAPLSGGSSTGGSWTTTLEVCDQALPGDASAMSTDCSTATGGLTAGSPYPNPCFVCGSVGATGTDLRIDGLENNIAYQFAVVAIDKQGNVSAVSTVLDATPVPTTDFAEHYSASGGAEEGGFCFIATAVYGDYDHPNVRQLRTYRDRVLARSEGGQRFVDWYYANGPKLVRLQRLFPQLRLVSRLGLEGLTWVSTQLTAGRGGGSQRAALPLGMLLLGALLSLRHLTARREEEPEEPDPAPDGAPESDPEVMP